MLSISNKAVSGRFPFHSKIALRAQQWKKEQTEQLDGIKQKPRYAS